MEFENILFEVKDRIAVITMNRPKAMNALNSATLSDLNKALDEIESNAEIKGVIITGTGKAFVAGADISQMAEYNTEQASTYTRSAQKVFNRMEEIEKPFLAAVNGYALGGGCEIAMACDFRYASETAAFGQPEITLGIIPGFGGTQRLPRLVGLGMAKELIYSGGMFKADEALRIGLVNKVCAAEQLLEEAMKTMKNIVAKPATGLSKAKVAINAGLDTDIYKAIELERDLFALCFATEDQKEGMKAFLEKRPAQFKS